MTQKDVHVATRERGQPWKGREDVREGFSRPRAVMALEAFIYRTEALLWTSYTGCMWELDPQKYCIMNFWHLLLLIVCLYNNIQVHLHPEYLQHLAVLKGAVLKGAVLKVAVLKGAVIKVAVLKGAVLKGAVQVNNANWNTSTRKAEWRKMLRVTGEP